MIPVYIYTRYSSHMQSNCSHELQYDCIKRRCDADGYEIIKWFKDSAISGTISKREGLDDMLSSLAENQDQIEKVIVYKIERLTRDLEGGLQIVSKIRELGVELESVNEHISKDVNGEFSLHMNMAMAQHYIASLSAYTKAGCLSKAKHACFLGGRIPIGFMLSDDRKLIKDPETYKTVEMIYTLFSKGYSYRMIADYLNERHLGNYSNNPWTGKSDFYSILTNPKYKGTYIYNRIPTRVKNKRTSHRHSKPKEEIITIDGGVDAIVSVELWEECQKILHERAKEKGALSAKQCYKLSGLITCGYCGSKFHGNNHGANSKKPWITYRCATRGGKDLTKSCSCKELNKEYIERLAIQTLSKYLRNSETISLLTEMLNDYAMAQPQEIIQSIARLEDKQRQCENNLENLLDVLQKGSSSKALINRLSDLENEKRKIEHDISSMRSKVVEVTPYTKKQVKAMFDDSANALLHSEDVEIKKLLKQLFKKIVITNEEIEFVIDLNRFFGENYNLPLKTMKFNRDYVVKYKGSLQKLLFRQKQKQQQMLVAVL